MKPLTIIVAVADNYAIGKDNQLLWHLPEDLKHFKKVTENHTIIMGKKTYDSLPRRPLPNRTNVVLSNHETQLEGCLMASSVEQALDMCDPDQENFIIGGASIYRQFLPFVQKIYLTHVSGKFDADTFFPDVDFSTWEVIDQKTFPKDEKHLYPFELLTYQRKIK